MKLKDYTKEEVDRIHMKQTIKSIACDMKTRKVHVRARQRKGKFDATVLQSVLAKDRSSARHLNVAYGLMRGCRYLEIEQSCHIPVNLLLVIDYLSIFGYLTFSAGENLTSMRAAEMEIDDAAINSISIVHNSVYGDNFGPLSDAEVEGIIDIIETGEGAVPQAPA